MQLIVKLVWDSTKPDAVHVPFEMGNPRHDQLQGSPRDMLAELCGRVCYDSLGKGRGSEEYHRNVQDQRHLSIYEHCVFTVQFDPARIAFPVWFNRPSLYVDTINHRVTLNLRHVMEWDAASQHNGYAMSCELVGSLLHACAASLAPRSMGYATSPPGYLAPLRLVEQVRGDHERWLSLYIGGVSRNLTHELVRHGDWTAISQRSTRYCDEDQTPIVWHPALADLMRRDGELDDTVDWLTGRGHDVYRRIVDALVNRGHDRKTARGAARGVLPSALGTELIMSASVAQWRHIVNLRGAGAADAEIRGLAALIGEVL